MNDEMKSKLLSLAEALSTASVALKELALVETKIKTDEISTKPASKTSTTSKKQNITETVLNKLANMRSASSAYLIRTTGLGKRQVEGVLQHARRKGIVSSYHSASGVRYKFLGNEAVDKKPKTTKKRFLTVAVSVNNSGEFIPVNKTHAVFNCIYNRYKLTKINAISFDGILKTLGSDQYVYDVRTCLDNLERRGLIVKSNLVGSSWYMLTETALNSKTIDWRVVSGDKQVAA